MGLPAQKLDDVREYARVMRALWRGEMVETAIEGNAHKIQFMHPPHMAGVFVNTADVIPVHLSAFGPKGRQLVVAIADGFINPWTSPAALHDARSMRAACAAAGRDPAALYTTSLNMGCVLASGEAYDSPRARAQAGPWPAIYWHWLVEDGDRASVPPDLQPVIDAYHEIYARYAPADARYLELHAGHLMYLRPEEQQFITGAMLQALTLTGSPNEIRARVHALDTAGYDQVAVQLVPGQEAAIEDWAQILLRPS